jgi:O-succinylbenzoate synthase
LKIIKPQYIILKPSLIGGFSGSDEWIELAEQNNIGWWITSALESNIGLNAIAQYTYIKKIRCHKVWAPEVCLPIILKHLYF